jgi:ribose-phosphate pyrophosphokinase
MKPLLFALPGNDAFCARLAAALPGETGALEYRRFPDGESYVRLLTGVAGREVALVCTLNAPDDKALSLLFAARTAKELGASGVGLVAPYLAYMRQDRRFHDGEAITSDYFASLISSSFDWLVTVDPHLHRRQSLAELYTIPAQTVAAAPALAAWIRGNVERPLIVGPDSESEQWAAEVAKGADAPYVVLSKTRRGDREVEIKAPPLERWKQHRPVLIDDIISSARTMAAAARIVAGNGMDEPICAGVHGVFAAGALQALRAAGVSRLVTSNTIAHETNAIDISPAVAQAIKERTCKPGTR